MSTKSFPGAAVAASTSALALLSILAAAAAACSGESASPMGRATETEAPVIERSSSPTSPPESNGPAQGPAGATDAGAPEADASTPSPASHFECKKVGANAYRPYWVQVTKAADGTFVTKDWSTTPKGLLGQNAMTSQAECDQARAAANDAYGVICSRTGLDGYKPTLYTGTVPGRADFGYLGGSSIMNFGDCLKATKSSSSAGVCFWGGSEWYVSPIDHEGLIKGPFSSVDACVAQTKAQ